MKIALYGLLPVLLYLAWTSHDKGETILTCVMIGAAGICYGIMKHESPRREPRGYVYGIAP